MTQLPLCTQAGLKVVSFYGPLNQAPVACILASEVEAMLANAIQVYGGRYCLGGNWSFVDHANAPYTHTAFLINIKSREKPDTAEQILKDLIPLADYGTREELDELAQRARNLLDKGEK